MVQKLQKKMKEQKGFTLIELLAVIVILGILAAIAVPSIMGIIDNTKMDAHAANAEQMINSAKLAVTDNKTLLPATTKSTMIPLKYLEDNGYIDTLKDPDGKTNGYESVATVPADYTAVVTGDSYVVVTNTANKITYKVRLYSTDGARGVQMDAVSKAPVPDGNLSRSNVH